MNISHWFLKMRRSRMNLACGSVVFTLIACHFVSGEVFPPKRDNEKCDYWARVDKECVNNPRFHCIVYYLDPFPMWKTSQLHVDSLSCILHVNRKRWQCKVPRVGQKWRVHKIAEQCTTTLSRIMWLCCGLVSLDAQTPWYQGTSPIQSIICWGCRTLFCTSGYHFGSGDDEGSPVALHIRCTQFPENAGSLQITTPPLLVNMFLTGAGGHRMVTGLTTSAPSEYLGMMGLAEAVLYTLRCDFYLHHYPWLLCSLPSF